MAKLCIICNEIKAEVPDREKTGRPIKKLCRPCHIKRLQNDLENIKRTRDRAIARILGGDT